MTKLFSEFNPHTAADWKNQLLRDLKGEPLESLTWHNENGFDIQPFYTAEDLHQNYLPAFLHSDWDITYKTKSTQDPELNRDLLRALQSGASSIFLTTAANNWATALQKVELPYIRSSFTVNASNANALVEYLLAQPASQPILCNMYVENLAKTGITTTWLSTIKTLSALPSANSVVADVTDLHNQNPHAYYEIALAFALLIDQLEHLRLNNHPLPSTVVIKTGVSSDFFVQMAKLRAMHRLWPLLAAEYKQSIALHLVVETSLTNKSISDAYNNLLRTTVESMAAVAGGCHELIVNAFDTLFPSNNTSASRLAINQQLILKEESYLHKMADVACGAYYIETITDALANKALEAFRAMEQQGGYTACIQNGSISSALTKQASTKAEALKQNKDLYIGVNKFKNEKESITLSDQAKQYIQSLGLNNPLVDFEFEHFFKTHA